MKTLITILMASVLLTPVPASNVSGTWNLEMRWPGDRRSTGVCTFNQDEQKLTGSCGGDSDRFPLTGQADGNRLTWQFDVEQNGETGRMAFDGELDQAGTAIKGACSIVERQDGTFTMVKRP
jgi:hypothetical protein